MSGGQAELAIAGGGPAGAALACLASRAGRETVLVERETGPRDKVCGDFLSGEAALYLRALGVGPEDVGAVPIRRLRLAAAHRIAEVRLPFEAWSLRRRILDELILSRAAASGARVVRGQRVEALAPDGAGGGWMLRLAGGDPIRTRRAALATGKHDLRGWKRGPGRQSDLIGFKWYVRLAPAEARTLGDAVELGMFGGGYAGLQPVDGGAANLCLVVRRDRFARLGRSAEALLEAIGEENALLASRLAGASLDRGAPIAIASMPYGFVAAGAPSRDVLRVGDQAAVIPSFTGDGISLALHGAFRAASFLGPRAGGFQEAFSGDVRRPVALATSLSRLAVRPCWQAAIMSAVQVCPALLGFVARLTRVPDRKLLG